VLSVVSMEECVSEFANLHYKMTTSYGIHRSLLHNMLRDQGGDKALVLRILHERGIMVPPEFFYRFIREDPVLSVVWGAESNRIISTIEPPQFDGMVVKPSESQLLEEARSRQDAFEFASAIHALGRSPDECREMVNYMELTGRHFKHSLMAVHGMSLDTAMELKKRMRWIEEEVILNDREMDNGKGFMVPCFSAAEKAAWQTRWNECADQIRRILEVYYKGAEVIAEGLNRASDRTDQPKRVFGAGKKERAK
jgi:hypothetical protein